MVVIILDFIGLSICARIYARDGKIALICLGVGGILALGTYFLCVFPYQEDINKQAYVMYTGEFYVEDGYGVSRSGMFIFVKNPDDKEVTLYHVECAVNEIERDSTYNGYYVYAKNSKTLVDIKVSNISN